MWIMNYHERESFKKYGESQALEARYHRFIGDYFGASGFEVDDQDIPISFQEYVSLLEKHPGWSCGRISPSSRHWRSEFFQSQPLMNKIYDMALANRARLAEKYKAISEQVDELTI